MDKILYLTLLYDFYGELLTERQKEIFEMYYQNDLSMQEIGDQFDISRQSVNDILKRTEKLLTEYEENLGLVNSHTAYKDRVQTIIKYIDDLIVAESYTIKDLIELKSRLSELQ